MPIWDIALRKHLRHASGEFVLDVRFASEAQRLVLFGASGAGKTQALRMIAGIVAPDTGRVAIASRVLLDTNVRLNLSPQARRLAFVFQDYALFPHLTVRQNIAFARRRGWRNPSRAFVDTKVDRWIEAFRLQRVADLHPTQISGGQRQRTALARALVNDPQALLLDEPFAALDKGLRRHLRDELRELQRSLSLPLLLITHDDDDVSAFADEVITLEAGRVIDQTAGHS